MKIVFALVVHGNPRPIERLICALVGKGHHVALHYDLKSPAADYQYLRDAFAGSELVCFARRVRVRWAEWSIIEAALGCLDEIAARGWDPDYVYHLSGMDFPIRSSDELVSFLERNRGKEFIESVPADAEQWVRTGPQQERYQYRYYFNWRDQRALSDLSLAIQQKLGLKRKFVRDMVPYIGSQWWVLTWDTLKQVLRLARERDIARFFRTVLVPDELFFQTMVRRVVPAERIVSRTLTLYQFTDYGYPVVYYPDHVEYLVRQPFFMARKIAPSATELREALDAYWRGERAAIAVEDAAIGRRSLEYEAQRLTYRDGVAGQPIPGHAPRRRYGQLERVDTPFFVVIGTSSAELRAVRKALSQYPSVLCHGELFHKRRIGFAEGRTSFAGYAADAVKLRGVSPGSFLADIVRAEKERLTGFLLIADQGWHMPEVMFERPNIRVLIVRGDPLIAFSEQVLKTDALRADASDRKALDAIPPRALARRYRRALPDFEEFSEWLDQQTRKAADIKPAGWVSEIALTAHVAPRAVPAPGDAQILLLRWHDGPAELEAGLGIEPNPEGQQRSRRIIAAEQERLEYWRRLVQHRITLGEANGRVRASAAPGEAPPRAVDRAGA